MMGIKPGEGSAVAVSWNSRVREGVSNYWRNNRRHLRRGTSLFIGVFAVCAVCAPAQAATLSLGDVTAIPAQAKAALPLSLAVASGEQLSDLVWDIRFDPAVAQFDSVVLEPTIAALGKQVATNIISAGQVRVVVYGLDQQVFPSGQVGRCLLNVAASVAAGSSIISLQNGSGSDINGIDFPLALSDGRLWIETPPDTIAPQLNTIAVGGITQTTATVTWTTDELATSQAEYGLTTGYGAITPLDSTLTLAHAVALSGLTPGTLYHLRVHSADALNNEAISADITFTTLAPPAAATPALSPVGGSFAGSVTVSITTATQGATLRYTLDGSDPTAASAVYAQPFVLSASAVVKARAFKSGMSDSAVASGTFTITSSTSVTFTAVQTSAASSNWWTIGSERASWVSGVWLEYPVDFGTGGQWTLNLTGTNLNSGSSGLPAGYAFNISVAVDGAYKGTLLVPGSTTSYQTGSIVLTMPAGTHTVRFTWTNDAWLAGVYDANLRVRSVSFVPGATVVVPGPYNFTATQTQAASTGWTVAGTERYSWAANQWLEYQSVDFGSGGTWTVGVTATNQKNLKAPGLPSGYMYNLDIYIDGIYRGLLQVPGSTTSYQTGYKTITMPSGKHTVRMIWTNDAWSDGLYDANIRIQSVNMRAGQ